MPCSLAWEDRLHSEGVFPVAGIDEAGRGCLAGPVVAAAVVIPRGWAIAELTEIDDSKKLNAATRERLYSAITADAALFWAVGTASVEEIDTINILRASHLAMRRAVEALTAAIQVMHVLIDGLHVRDFPLPQTPLVGGDGISASIAAASILAKVTRDRLMVELDGTYPGYSFGRHKGYGTPEHQEALRRLGPCAIHRRSFSPVSQIEFQF